MSKPKVKATEQSLFEGSVEKVSTAEKKPRTAHQKKFRAAFQCSQIPEPLKSMSAWARYHRVDETHIECILPADAEMQFSGADLLSWSDENCRTLDELDHGVGDGFALCLGNQRLTGDVCAVLTDNEEDAEQICNLIPGEVYSIRAGRYILILFVDDGDIDPPCELIRISNRCADRVLPAKALECVFIPFDGKSFREPLPKDLPKFTGGVWSIIHRFNPNITPEHFEGNLGECISVGKDGRVHDADGYGSEEAINITEDVEEVKTISLPPPHQQPSTVEAADQSPTVEVESAEASVEKRKRSTLRKASGTGKPFDRAPLDAAKQKLLAYLAEIGHAPNARGMLHCIRPSMHKHGDRTPSMQFNADSNTVYCHGCGFTGDLVDVIAEVKGFSPRSKEAIAETIAWAGTGEKSARSIPRKMPATVPSSPADASTIACHTSCAARFRAPLSVDFWRGRGFDSEDDLQFLESFRIGFDEVDRLIVIPHTDAFCTRRAVDSHKFLYIKGSKAALFNADALTQPIVAVAEGAIDALSILRAGLPAVALGGVQHIKLLLTAITELEQPPRFLIAFDNDDPGRKSAEELKERLEGAGIATLMMLPTDDHDFNDFFKRDRAALASFLEEKKAELSTLPEPKSVAEPKSTADDDDDPRGVLEAVTDFTAEEVFSEEVLKAAAKCERDYPAAFDKFRSAVKQHKLSVKLFDKQVRLKQQAQAAVCPVDETTCLPSLPSGRLVETLIGESFAVGLEGSFALLTDSLGNQHWRQISYDPIVVDTLIENIDEGTFKMRLAAFKSAQNRWLRTPPFDNDTLANASRITEVSRHGLDVRSTQAKLLVDFLAAQLEQCRADIPVERTVNRPGWQKDGSFVYPNTAPNAFHFSSYRLDDGIRNTVDRIFTSEGSKAPVIDALKKLQDNDIAQAVIGTALAAPLVKVFRRQNIALHIYANTGSGKSTLTKLALSLFANPNADGALPTANATKVGLELLFASLYDFAAVVEDIDSISDEHALKVIRDLPYQFMNKTGRLRGKKEGGLQKLNEFRGALITNGEQPLTDDSSKGGGKRRVLEFKGGDKILDAAAARHINRLVQTNYGLFGREWIDAIVRLGDQFFIDKCNAIHEKIFAANEHKSPLHIDSLAAITVANILFRAHILGEDAHAVDAAELERALRLANQLPDEEEIKDYVRAKRFVADWIFSHPRYFRNPRDMMNDDKKRAANEEYGILVDNAYYLYETPFKDALKNHGFAAQMMIRQFADDGFIDRESKKNLKRRPPDIAFANDPSVKPPRMYKIPVDKLNALAEQPNGETDSGTEGAEPSARITVDDATIEVLAKYSSAAQREQFFKDRNLTAAERADVRKRIDIANGFEPEDDADIPF